METISIKIDKGLLVEIDSKLGKHRYGTRTELIREAIREKIKDLEKEEAFKRLEKYYGASMRKTTDKELHKSGDKAARELAKTLGLILD